MRGEWVANGWRMAPHQRRHNNFSQGEVVETGKGPHGEGGAGCARDRPCRHVPRRSLYH